MFVCLCACVRVCVRVRLRVRLEGANKPFSLSVYVPGPLTPRLTEGVIPRDLVKLGTKVSLPFLLNRFHFLLR